MKQLLVFVLSLSLSLAGTQLLAQSPQINAAGVLNGATLDPTQPLAPGVIFSLSGTNLTGGGIAAAVSTPLPTRLAGAQVLVNGIAAPLFFVSPLQILAQLPVEVPGGTLATIRVEVVGANATLTSNSVQVQVAAVSPGIFTWDQNGKGPGAILHTSDSSWVCPLERNDCVGRPAVRGEPLAMYLTGLGAVNGPWVSGAAAVTPSPTVATASVTIGGIAATVPFSVLASGSVGLYQVNVLVPENAPAGNDVPLTLTIAGAASNTVTLAISGPPLDTEFTEVPGGTVRAVAMDPANPSILYAGTAGGGVFKSTNGGQGWTASSSGLTTLVITSLAVNPANPSTVYAGTAGGGIFKSSNGGSAWTPASTGLPLFSSLGIPGIISTLVMDPSNPSNLYAAISTDDSNDGIIYKTTNAGEAWFRSDTGIVTQYRDTVALALIIDPRQPSTLYVGTTDQGIFRTTDSGANWQAINTGLTFLPSVIDGGVPPIVLSLAISSQDSAVLYAGTIGGLFRSNNGGQNWAPINNGLPVVEQLGSPGAVPSLAVDPTNSSTVYASILALGSADGIYRTTDSGQNWSRVSPGLSSTLVLALTIHPGNPATVYAGTFGRGVYKTSDSGGTWNASNTGLSAGMVLALATDPGNPNTLYAGTADGVLKSTNGGRSWNRAQAGISNSLISVLAVDPMNSSTLYAGTGLPAGPGSTGVFKSTDGGQSWSPINNGLPTNPLLSVVTSVAIVPSNPSIIYAGTLGGVYKTSNGGLSWTAANSGLERSNIELLPGIVLRPILNLVVDRSQSSTVFAVTHNAGVFRSTDAGQSWTQVTSGRTSQGYPAPPYFDYDYWALAFDPLNATTLYAVSIGAGAYRSTNSGVTWDNLLGHQIALSYFNQLVLNAVNPSTLYAGAGGSIFKTTNGGQNWTAVNAGLPLDTGYSYLQDLAIDPANSSRLYAGFSPAGIFKTTNGGQNWVAANSGLPLNTYTSALAIDPVAPSTLYAATSSGIYQSTNAAQSWNKVSVSSSISVSDILVEPRSSSTLYGAGYDGFYKSTDSGRTWTRYNAGLPQFPNFQLLVIDPVAANTLYAGSYDGVYKSTNGGQSWAFASSGLPADYPYVQSLAIDPNSPATLYAATSEGVYKSTNGGAQWTATNLRGLWINTIAIDPSQTATVYAAQSDRGIFKSTDGGVTWSANNDLPVIPFGGGNAVTYSLLVHPQNPATMLAVVLGLGVLRSSDSASNWSAANAGLPAALSDRGQSLVAVSALAASAGNPATLYVGTVGRGVFKSTDGGSTWVPANAD